MIEIIDKSKCCGCTACSNICPKSAIDMVEDSEGFLYPKVDKEKCINCGLCNKVCPIENKNENNYNVRAFSVRIKDKQVLKKSTSGGFFTPLSKYVLKRNGFVFGVGYDNNLKVIHKQINHENRINELIGSKYVQSYLGNTFEEVKKQLEKGILVLFSGVPCQLEGLKNYLGKEYLNLITLDLVCHGTPSPKLWKKYIEYQEKKYKSKIKEAYFRNKTYGYHNGTMKLVFENKKKYYGSARVDFMLKSFFSEISSRPSCYQCAFKKKKHNTDFTAFDCWHISNVVRNLKDDDKGYTNIIVNSKKGMTILDSIKDDIDLYPVDLESIIKLDGSMIENSTIPHKARNEFYKTLNQQGIEETINKYIPVSKFDYIFEFSKKILYRSKFIKKIKNMKG